VRWELHDGDFVDVDRLAGPPGAPLLLVLHGLEGSSRSPYVRGTLEEARRRGLRGCALNFRSCSDEPNRLLRSYHSGETGDLDEAVRRLLAESGAGSIGIVGYSLGGNLLVKWLGEQGASIDPRIRAAAAVSVPFDLALCAKNLDGPGAMRAIYRENFLRTLRRKALSKAATFPGRLDPARIRSVRTLYEFDDAVTAPLHGFDSAHDYWTRCSSGQFLDAVRVPLLLLSAADDPIVPAESLSLAREAARKNPLLQLEVTDHGGHVGFVAGPPWAPQFWAEERAAGFVSSRLRAID
jgi:predicted alpha/beta-fold hydrolase